MGAFVSSNGLCKAKNSKNAELAMEVGRWVQRSHSENKLLENRPKIVLIFWSSIPCVLCLCNNKNNMILGVLSMSVLDFPKKVWMGVSSIQFYFVFFKHIYNLFPHHRVTTGRWSN